MTRERERAVSLRILRFDDFDDVVDLAMSTFALGKPVEQRWMRRYVEAGIRPFVLAGQSSSVVAVDGLGTVIGYALVCVDPARTEARLRRSMLLHSLTVPWSLVAGGRPAWHFYVDRCRDVPDLVRPETSRSDSPHVHLNIRLDQRSGSAALALLESIDTTVRESGASRWLGEVNALVGRRASALERLGFSVRHRVPNRTLSRLVGRPVERLMLERQVGDQLCSGAPSEAMALAQA
jgi:hypothetical protein